MYTVGRGWAWHMTPSLSSETPAVANIEYMATHDVANITCSALVRGVARSKRRAMKWMRRSAELGNARWGGAG
jgi:TPR repeat protein